MVVLELIGEICNTIIVVLVREKGRKTAITY